MIFADIPVNEPNNEFSGYSRAGTWHIVLDTEGYTSRSPACVDPPFSTCKVKHQYLQAFRSVDEERKYREKEAEQIKVVPPKPAPAPEDFPGLVLPPRANHPYWVAYADKLVLSLCAGSLTFWVYLIIQ
jgi:hypothetical protein